MIDPILKQVADTIGDTPLVDCRKKLESIFGKKNVDFSFMPVPHFSCKHKGKKITIANKNSVEADESTLIAGNNAIGFQS